MRQTEHAKADILFDGATITAVGPDLSTPAADGRTILRSAELLPSAASSSVGIRH